MDLSNFTRMSAPALRISFKHDNDPNLLYKCQAEHEDLHLFYMAQGDSICFVLLGADTDDDAERIVLN